MRLAPAALSLITTAAVAVSSPRTTFADDAAEADALVAQGEEFGRKFAWSQAIDKFKRADALVQRARHACLIALAYQRRELFPQAEIFIAKCHDRAAPTDPAPDWLADAEKQLADKLATLDVAAVEIRVEPADAAVGATVAVSSFAPDETFTPRTIHLPRGSHVITATTAGYPPKSETVVITGREPRTVTIDVSKRPKALVIERPFNWSVLAFIGAGVFAGAGAVFHGLAYKERSDLFTTDPLVYRKHEKPFERWRALTFTCYGLAAASAGVGIWLRLRRHGTESPMVTGAITDDGAMVVVEWQR